MNWFILALLAMLFFSGMILVFKKIVVLGVQPATLMLYVAIFLTIFYILHILITKTPVKVNTPVLLWLVLAAFLSYAANLFYTKSIALAPNPGYSATIVSLQLAIIAIASFFLFGSELTLLKGAGIFLAIVAAVLLAL